MVAGALGGFLTGIFATVPGVASFGDTNPGGAIDGNGRQVWLQIIGALFIFGWNVVWTSLIMLFIKYVLRIPLRMTEEQCLVGDDAIHGEAAYCFYEVDDESRVGDPQVIEGQESNDGFGRAAEVEAASSSDSNKINKQQ